MSAAVFAYASLAHPASAAETLGRDLEVLPARLDGWRRRWTLARDNRTAEKRFALADGSRPAYCLALNLEPEAGGPAPNGGLVEVTQAELERLDRREIRYRRADVSAAVSLSTGERPGFRSVFAYVARPENHSPEPPAGSVVIAAYLETVERAFAALGAEELELFRASTEPPPAPVADAVLVHDEVLPGNPRRW